MHNKLIYADITRLFMPPVFGLKNEKRKYVFRDVKIADVSREKEHFPAVQLVQVRHGRKKQ